MVILSRRMIITDGNRPQHDWSISMPHQNVVIGNQGKFYGLKDCVDCRYNKMIVDRIKGDMNDNEEWCCKFLG